MQLYLHESKTNNLHSFVVGEKSPDFSGTTTSGECFVHKDRSGVFVPGGFRWGWVLPVTGLVWCGKVT